MELVIAKEVKNEASVRSHPLFGKAVFIECGLHEPINFCYDHHAISGGAEFQLSSAGQIYQELSLRRRLPIIVVMNHVRHLDNLLALYLLNYRALITSPDTFILVHIADAMDRIGPATIASLPQLQLAVLTSAQDIIPFKEWELSEAELRDHAMKAIASIRRMVTLPAEVATYTTLYESPDKRFIVVTSPDRIGNILYDAGYDAYAVYTQNADGSYKWTLARLSEHVPFDMPAAFVALTALEPGGGEWSGRPVIGGSPRNTGTKLEPEAVVEVLKSFYTVG